MQVKIMLKEEVEDKANFDDGGPGVPECPGVFEMRSWPEPWTDKETL